MTAPPANDAPALFDWLAAEAARLPGPLAAWIGDGYARWLDGEDLESALSLKVQPGQRRAATRARMAKRDRHLRQAWALTAGATPWARARNLADAIGRLAVIHRRHRAGHPPATLQNAALCAARDCGPLPEDPKRLLAICARADGNEPALFISTVGGDPASTERPETAP